MRWWFLAAEAFLRAHARNRASILLTEERFGIDLNVARMTSRKALAVLRQDLAREEGSDFATLICTPVLSKTEDDASPKA